MDMFVLPNYLQKQEDVTVQNSIVFPSLSFQRIDMNSKCLVVDNTASIVSSFSPPLESSPFSTLFPTHGTEVTKSEMGFENDMGMINECDFANHELKKLVITGKTRAHCFVGEQQFVESDKDSDSLTLNGIHSL
ncbi:hypothetical protein BLNAU_24646 [Blattamonas nauphoetae]|uniref:Uncharacterized protein n=2 Tax=Blattamonas nauphoetae TaxID=2049346 RepID=A0ABQ9WLV2_9EUKA|nr:hypothetical protein BLNAU_24646 [Blattamonas nauphoetae]